MRRTSPFCSEQRSVSGQQGYCCTNPAIQRGGHLGVVLCLCPTSGTSPGVICQVAESTEVACPIAQLVQGPATARSYPTSIFSRLVRWPALSCTVAIAPCWPPAPLVDFQLLLHLSLRAQRLPSCCAFLQAGGSAVGPLIASLDQGRLLWARLCIRSVGLCEGV